MAPNSQSLLRRRSIDQNDEKQPKLVRLHDSDSESSLDLSSSYTLSKALSTSSNLPHATKYPTKAHNQKKPRSFQSRGEVPTSTYVTLILVVVQPILSGVFSDPNVGQKLGSGSVRTAKLAVKQMLLRLREVWQDGIFLEFANVLLGMFLASFILYIFVVAPMRAGFWTGKRSKRQVIHRYMGLSYLTLYTFAWVLFLTDYDSYKESYVPYLIALNGLIQAHSAFFSFKVLPDLEDAGYYSDVAVLSRTFVHENGYFQLMALFGSLFYVDASRHSLQSTLWGKIFEALFVFFPYVLIRPYFPVTKFSKAGTSSRGRSKGLKQFYEIGTLTVKIFYLWAKYFLGFFINFSCSLHVVSDNDMRFIRAFFLLNLGTISLSVFLHTLRFKKVLPPWLTFSVYLAQIYSTFSFLPLCRDLFWRHKKLCGLCGLGLLGNMTRRKDVHLVWCILCFVLMKYFTDIVW